MAPDAVAGHSAGTTQGTVHDAVDVTLVILGAPTAATEAAHAPRRPVDGVALVGPPHRWALLGRLTPKAANTLPGLPGLPVLPMLAGLPGLPL